MRIRVLSPLIFALLLVGLSLTTTPRAVRSQDAAESCIPAVQTALQQVGDLCDGLSRNSACYGNSNVEATFVSTESSSQFAEPGDTATVATIQTIHTAPLDESSDIWGVSLLRLQANVPESLPGQGVVFVLFGDVEIENAVSTDDMFILPSEPVTVTTLSAANLRSGSSKNASVIVSLPAGTQLPADATSADKEWLRVVSDKTVGWVSTSVVDAPANSLNGLPVLSRTARAPMQAFYLTSTLTQVNCKQAPPMVVLQGPEDVTVDLTVNGVNINMASTVAVRLVGPRLMEVTAIHGNIHVDGLPLPPGFRVDVPLSEDGHSREGDLANVRAIGQPELDELVALEIIPANVLNYPIVLPTTAEINALSAAVGGSGGGIVSAAAAAHVTCRSLRLTSPLENWAQKETPFYWNPAPGATGYRLVIEDVNTWDTTDTTLSLNLSGVASNTLTWSVQAMYNGEVACQTGKLTLPLVGTGASGGGGSNCHYDIATFSMVCN